MAHCSVKDQDFLTPNRNQTYEPESARDSVTSILIQDHLTYNSSRFREGGIANRQACSRVACSCYAGGPHGSTTRTEA